MNDSPTRHDIRVDRVDPGRTGVKAGRVVGALTALLAVISLVWSRGTFYEGMATALDLLGIDGLPVRVLFWGNVLFAASARYAIGYVVGSLLGVVYDWLDRPPLAVLVGMVLVVGTVDGMLAAIDAWSFVLGIAYVLAWLCYVPAFVWLYDGDPSVTSTLGDARY